MPKSVESPKISVSRTVIAIGLLIGWTTVPTVVLAQDAATTEPSLTEELLLSPTSEDATVLPVVEADETKGRTPSFDDLDSAASDLNEALSGARAKLDELRQATELAAMAAELREELEASIQENNRLAASLADVQSERSDLELQKNEAEREIVKLTAEVETARLEIVEQTAELEQQEGKIAEEVEARGNAEGEIRELKSQLADSGVEVDQLRINIAELAGELETTRTELDEALGDADEAREAHDSADRELSKVRMQIAGMLRSVLLGGEPIDVGELEEEGAELSEENNFGLGLQYEAVRASNVRAAPDPGFRTRRLCQARRRGDGVEEGGRSKLVRSRDDRWNPWFHFR